MKEHWQNVAVLSPSGRVSFGDLVATEYTDEGRITDGVLTSLSCPEGRTVSEGQILVPFEIPVEDIREIQLS